MSRPGRLLELLRTQRRRGVTLVTVYGSVALGIAGSLTVLRVLGPTGAGKLAIVLGVADFLALCVSLTSNEVLVKYGFRYVSEVDWGRFHRLVRLTFRLEVGAALLATVLILILAPFASSIFKGTGGLMLAFLLVALLPPLQAIEVLAGTAMLLRGRYDLRGVWLAISAALRTTGLIVGALHGVTDAVIGVIAAQVATTASVFGVGMAGLRRFPAAPPRPLGDDARPIARFIAKSASYTALLSLRTWVAPLTLGIVRSATQVGLFRGAQGPQTAFAALSSPMRLILFTEQTRDWEHGRRDVVLAGLRRYVVGATAFAVLGLVPAELAMPWLVRVILGSHYEPAVDAARLVLGAAAIHLVFGWTKSLPVTIGRPGLRVIAHGVETAVLLPLIVVFGKLWGVSGAGVAVLVSAAVFALVWCVLVVRLRRSGFGATSTAATPSSA